MDGNKDEALKCLRIGKEALDSSDRARALKFLTKARRLDPSLPIDALISSAGGQSPPETPTPSAPDSADPPPPDKPSALNSAMPRAPAKGPSSASSSSAAFTHEQISIVRQIKREKDYYAILGLDKGCSVEDVRKAYRKISLKVHPDKNKAPGAEDAFKAVSKAFQCLSSEESRRQYDLVGSEEEFVQRRRSTHATHRGFSGFYQEEFDPDEIFRSFFFGGGGMTPATTFQGFRFGTNMGPSAARHGQGQGQGHGSGNLRTLIQLLPVIFILLMNFLPSSDPVYSLSRTYPYQHQVVTAKGVPFYVKLSKFEEDYPLDSLERLSVERHVERDYVGFLSQNCRVELQRRHWGLAQQTPHCDKLEQFSAVA